MMASSCTSVERANGRVLAVAGDVAELVAQGGVQASVDAAWRAGVLARPGLASARSSACLGMTWACLVLRVLASVGFLLALECVQRDQQGKVHLQDMAWHGGFGQK
jgi:hypothetical protein